MSPIRPLTSNLNIIKCHQANVIILTVSILRKLPKIWGAPKMVEMPGNLKYMLKNVLKWEKTMQIIFMVNLRHQSGENYHCWIFTVYLTLCLGLYICYLSFNLMKSSDISAPSFQWENSGPERLNCKSRVSLVVTEELQSIPRGLNPETVYLTNTRSWHERQKEKRWQ